ncbi:GlxA family transcriptional regulator [Burkholderia oklahomensis]|uniref:GlxA family transcriptional regulator n=1 Tax=Burkholderia oklahomensis TaxID=342113 RepID=UPI00016A85F4|nr:helix-turn-helix domain-containing protein [Burkholderia oklahomensis]AJX31672.1 helix-turn-helix domain protein [Burkholderia oklahomensis C6786]AOI44340.1 AraC family transcriptional regulator [Burkholderia oklahomensis C6786]KUY61650.1 AraC family transcriptional regulator [Burkholderia oklahomensis C6786]MBI0359686.1 helix-turn-helix domain-containing protein [Burkholderia oklahomensis]SUW58999.1 L-rhamnose operon transcriptional activator rhaR [Burkholderia oklahomensis]
MKKQPRGAGRPGVAILLPPRLLGGYVFLTQEMLLLAGTMKARSLDVVNSRLFDIAILSHDGRPVQTIGAIDVPATAALRDADAHEVVIVPAQFMPDEQIDAIERVFIDWLRRRYAAGALVVGLNAAPLLAKAGLLDGRGATGLPSERTLFARHFPAVRYTPSKPLVVDGRLITVSGINPAVDACAYVIDYCFGAGVSQRLLKVALTQALPSYEHMAVWAAQYKRHGDGPVLAIQDIVERALAQPPTLAELAARAAMSERTLSRRFAAATGLTLRRYVAVLRVELAAFLLRTSRMTLDHIADECGFASASALSHAFLAGQGCSPIQYRNRHWPDARPDVRRDAADGDTASGGRTGSGGGADFV